MFLGLILLLLSSFLGQTQPVQPMYLHVQATVGKVKSFRGFSTSRKLKEPSQERKGDEYDFRWSGEVVFSTAMVGYVEAATDPSYVISCTFIRVKTLQFHLGIWDKF